MAHPSPDQNRNGIWNLALGFWHGTAYGKCEGADALGLMIMAFFVFLSFASYLYLHSAIWRFWGGVDGEPCEGGQITVS